jgi:PTS system nitrogen regulatory IIA component
VKLTVREAAQLLSLSESDLYRWVDDGEIPFYMVNHQPLFSREELLEWATARHLPLSIELFADEGHMVPLADALARGGIHYDVAGHDRDSALRAVVRCLPVDDEGDRDMVLHIMLAREAELSTGVGRGIAIPHVRAPLVFAGRPAAVALCFLEQPVPFKAVDDQPVSTIFAMMTPRIRGHLQMLSRLSLGLHDAGFAAAVAARADRDTILAAAKHVDDNLAAKGLA